MTVGSTSAAKRLLSADMAWEARRPRTERDTTVQPGKSGDKEKAPTLPRGLVSQPYTAPCAGRTGGQAFSCHRLEPDPYMEPLPEEPLGTLTLWVSVSPVSQWGHEWGKQHSFIPALCASLGGPGRGQSQDLSPPDHQSDLRSLQGPTLTLGPSKEQQGFQAHDQGAQQ